MYDSAQAVSFWQDERKWKATRHKPTNKKAKAKSHAVIYGSYAYVLLTAAMAISIIVAVVGYVLTLPGTAVDPAIDSIALSNTDSGVIINTRVNQAGAVRKEVLTADIVTIESIVDKIPTAPAVVSGIPIIVVDAGHGGEDEGCSRAGVEEKDINLAIALLVEEKLTDLGYHVMMTREDDSYITVEDRVKIANENGAALYISIHQNAYEDESAQGIEVWYNKEKGDGESKRLALLVGQQTIKETEAWEREFRGDSQMYGVIHTTMPACLIETGFLSNAAERAKLITPEYQEQIAQGIVQGIEYYFHPKTMYLTFDDGPRPGNTELILDILKEQNIKAAFFVIGESVRNNPELARRIVAEGHTIGIHCNNHDYHTLYQSVESYAADFEAAHQAVLEVTGVDAKIFRFPGGSINSYNRNVSQAIIEEMTERGYIYYDWNASLEDAVNDPEPQQLITNAVESTFGREKVIMLAHDSVSVTALCLEELLDRFPEYKMEILTEEVKPVQF